MNTIGVFVNGSLVDKEFHTSLLKNVSSIICADGGANIVKTLGITPHYVIGDMDSIDKSLLKGYQENSNVTVITDKDENKTDTELAIALAQSFNPDEIIILGGIGNRMDHTIATLYSMPSNCKLINEKHEIFLITNSKKLTGNIGDIISVLPISKCEGLTYTGLKWNVTHKSVNAGWLGTSNEMIEKEATISITSGKLLVMKVKEWP